MTAGDDLFKIEDELLLKNKRRPGKVVNGTEIDDFSDSGKKKRKHKTLQMQKKKKRTRLVLEEVLLKDVKFILEYP